MQPEPACCPYHRSVILVSCILIVVLCYKRAQIKPTALQAFFVCHSGMDKVILHLILIAVATASFAQAASGEEALPLPGALRVRSARARRPAPFAHGNRLGSAG